MKQALPKHQLHNPFYNRFKVPVTQRLGEMQSLSYVTERDDRGANSTIGHKHTGNSSTSESTGENLFASAIALLVVFLVSWFMLVKGF